MRHNIFSGLVPYTHFEVCHHHRRGHYLMSAGTDGSLFVYEILGSLRNAPYASHPPATAIVSELLTSGTAPDTDCWDDPMEPTAAITIARQRAGVAGKSVARMSHSRCAHLCGSN
jgi:hypothetical protein